MACPHSFSLRYSALDCYGVRTLGFKIGCFASLDGVGYILVVHLGAINSTIASFECPLHGICCFSARHEIDPEMYQRDGNAIVGGQRA